jgi:hypothetical protein
MFDTAPAFVQMPCASRACISAQINTLSRMLAWPLRDIRAGRNATFRLPSTLDHSFRRHGSRGVFQLPLGEFE